MEKRTIQQIAAAGAVDDVESLFALDTEGHVWRLVCFKGKEWEWERMPDLPSKNATVRT